VKERPILFSAAMVRAILEGSKTQTRRIIKPQPRCNGMILNARAGEILCEDDYLPPAAVLWDVGKHRVTVCDLDGSLQLCCPYGVIGDTLWVRETWGMINPFGEFYDTSLRGLTGVPEGCRIIYRAGTLTTGGASPVDPVWRPSIHMPRWASRITLEVTGVRVERLKNISEADAIAEGCKERETITARGEYEALWESINGAGSWAANPWVWVVEFRRVQ
jgi:hypothetical protein